MVVPRGTRTLSATTVVADALLNAMRHVRGALPGDGRQRGGLHPRRVDFHRGDSVVSLNYPLPASRQIHTRIFWAPRCLPRGEAYSRDKYIEPALKVARYSAGRQAEDGFVGLRRVAHASWIGTSTRDTISAACRSILPAHCATSEIRASVSGARFEFYASFFSEDGAARYFSHHTLPLGRSRVRQGIITQSRLRISIRETRNCLGFRFLAGAMANMWMIADIFIYRVLRLPED